MHKRDPTLWNRHILFNEQAVCGKGTIIEKFTWWK